MISVLSVSTLARAEVVLPETDIEFDVGPNFTAFDAHSSKLQPKKGDFIDRLVKIAPSQSKRMGRARDRRLYELPSDGLNGSGGICGSKFIRAQRSKPYMRSVSACMLTAVAQEWKEKVCPGDTPDCQLLIGDMGYGDRKPKYWPHATHHDGDCVDIWPVRKKGFKGELNVNKPGYDSERTKKLMEIMVKWGAETTRDKSRAQLFFNDPKIYNDPKIGARKPGNTSAKVMRGHSNHIHACFRPTAKNYERCRNFKVDTLLCPTLRKDGEP